MAGTSKNAKNLIFSINELSKLLDIDTKAATSASLVSAIKGECSASDPVLSASALHVLTQLVEKGVLPLSKALSLVISMLSSKETIPSIVPAVCRLLLLDASQPDWQCPYTQNNRPHPFVTILKHDWLFWNEISSFLHYLFTENLSINHNRKIAIVRPLMSFVLADPTAPNLAKTDIAHLLMSRGEQKLFIELLSWQQVDFNWCTLIRITAETAQLNDHVRETLCPALAVAISYLTTYGHDPSLWICHLRHCWKDEHSDLVLNILAKVISSCPSIYLGPIVQFCDFIIAKKKCNVWSAGAVAAAILPWLISPSSLYPKLTENFQNISKTLPDLPKTGNAILQRTNVFLDSMPDARAALDLLILTEQWTDDAQVYKTVSKLNETFAPRWKSHLLAVLLTSKSVPTTKLVLNVLKGICQMDPGFCFPLWSVILFKLSKETNPHLQLYFLRMVPLMAIDKENMSLVLGTYMSLPSESTPLRLNFLFTLFSTQSRTFPYLHRLLQDASTHKSWEAQVACAAVLLKISQHSPDPHGRQVVAILNDILNYNSDDHGTEASALAVSAIRELCKANVIDIYQTWKALEPKMGKERRPAVAAAVCKLLGECAGHDSEECRAKAISRLWTFIGESYAVEPALLALGRFMLEDFQLEMIPERFQKNLPHLGLGELADVPSYVPGECWLQLLDKIEPSAIDAVEKMLTSLLKKEIKELPRGIYALPLGAEEPRNFHELPHKSLLRALVDNLQNIIRDNWKKPKLASSVMAVLGGDFLRPMPPINWSFLKPNPGDKTTLPLVVTILSRQGSKSPSARKTLQETITKLDVDKEIIPALCHVLPGISQCVTKSTLLQLVGDLLRISLDDKTMFKEVLNAVRRSVGLADVPEANRIALGNALRELLVDLPEDLEDTGEFWTSIAELPEEIIERIVRPQNWPEVTSRRIRYALHVAGAAAIKSEQPLELFTELIDVTCSRPEDHFLMKQQLAELFRRIGVKSGSGPFRLLMTRLLAAGNNSGDVQEKQFLFDVVVSCAVVASGYELFLGQEELHRKNQLNIFPGCVKMLFDDNLPEWMKNFPFFVESLYRLKKSENFSSEQREAAHRSLLLFKYHAYCLDPSRRSRLLH